MATKKPAYVKAFRSGRLGSVVRVANDHLARCELCPRKCRVNRLAGETGFCQTGKNALVSGWDAHFGEETPVVGQHGSGTIFFSHCNLLCLFCQNYSISHSGEGKPVTGHVLAGMMLDLQEKGCHNINFVSPSHVVPQILSAILIAVENGLRVPLVFNTGGYDRVQTLSLLDGIMDIYMPDFKFWDNDVAEKACMASDYREVTCRAVKEMHRQVGDLNIDEKGIAKKGLLVRHLVLPDGLAGTKEVMTFIADKVSKNTYINVMAQYRPCGKANTMAGFERGVSIKEFQAALNFAIDSGLQRLDRRALI